MPDTDVIHIPPPSAFIGSATSSPEETFYSTLLHELVHWTSAKDRCDRELGKRFGDAAYGMEELIAELGAAFLCADLGIASTPRLDHARYLASWLKVLRQDKRAIFTAASKASQAAAFLHALQPPGQDGDATSCEEINAPSPSHERHASLPLINASDPIGAAA